MDSQEVLRVVVVDDMEINQVGTSSVLSDVPGVEVAGVYDFAGAMARDDWSGVDWVVVDVADEFADSEQIPSQPLISRIRELAPDPDQPTILAVSSNPQAYNSGFIRRRLWEADPNIGLVWRADLEKRARTAVDARALDAKFRSAPIIEPQADFPSLGITELTPVNKVVTGSRTIIGKVKAGLTERQLFAERFGLANETGLEAKTADGNTPANTDTPDLRQLKRIDEATTLDRMGE